MKIRAKILFLVLSTSLLIFSASIGYVSLNYRNMAIKDAKKIAESYALQSSYLAKSILSIDLSVSRTVQEALMGFERIPKRQRSYIYDDIMRNVLIENPDYISVWVSWERAAIDSSWDKPYGRIRTAWYRNLQGIGVRRDTIDMEGQDFGSMYYKIKTLKEDESITEPYPFAYTIGDTILEATVTTRMNKNGKMAALIGVDVPLTRFQNIINKITPFEKSYVFIISNGGVIVGHPKKNYIGNSIANIYDKINIKYRLLEKVQNGEPFSMLLDSLMRDTTTFISFSPIHIGKTTTPWAIGMVVPVNIIMEQANHNFRISLIVGIGGLIVLSIIIWFISQSITKPLKATTQILKELDMGMIDKSKKLLIDSSDEIGEMARSVNKLIDTLNNMANFAIKIGQGDLTAEYGVLSEHDILGDSLLEMRKNLLVAKDEEKRRNIESLKTSWSQEGISMIGEIIRQNYETVEDFAYTVISTLVKYMNANQGGFYLINDNDPEDVHIELMSSYAYERKKMLDTRIAIGENLVGRCFQEKEVVVIDNLPEGYTFITSGLGEKTPTHLLIAPLVAENDSYGVIEIASFKRFEEHEVTFIERVCERLASSVSNIKKNTRTTALLKQSQKQSEELALREHELSVKLNELQEAQDEALGRELETSGILDAISSTAAVIYYDMKGTITFINDKNPDDLGLRREDVIGHNQSEFAQEAKDSPLEYKRFWDELRAGRSKKRLFYWKTGRFEKWLLETYTPIFNKDNRPYKVINIGIDITETKLLERKLKSIEEDIAAVNALKQFEL